MAEQPHLQADTTDSRYLAIHVLMRWTEQEWSKCAVNHTEYIRWGKPEEHNFKIFKNKQSRGHGGQAGVTAT